MELIEGRVSEPPSEGNALEPIATLPRGRPVGPEAVSFPCGVYGNVGEASVCACVYMCVRVHVCVHVFCMCVHACVYMYVRTYACVVVIKLPLFVIQFLSQSLSLSKEVEKSSRGCRSEEWWECRAV